jgi:hypothetical protein
MDVNISSDDDTVTTPKPDVSVSQKASASNDVGDDGASSAGLTTPSLISSSALNQSDPSAVD